MKAKPSIVFQSLRGSAGEITARQVHGNTILNAKAQQPNRTTPAQANRRAHFAFHTKMWKGLTTEEQKAWSQLSSQVRSKSIDGDGGAPLTGFGVFICVNTNRSVFELDAVRVPPHDIHGSYAVLYEKMWVTTSRIYIQGLQPPAIANARLGIRMTLAQEHTISNAWGKVVIIGSYDQIETTSMNLVTIYTSHFGMPVEAGKKYFFQFYWIDPDCGFMQNVTRDSAVAENSL